MSIRSLASFGFLFLLPGFGWCQSPSSEREAVLALSHRVDAHLSKGWSKHGASPATLADDYTYFRRLNLDLRGKIPSLTELHDFIDDTDSDKRWMWVERFLEDDRFVRHFARFYRGVILGNNPSPQGAAASTGFEAWMRGNLKQNVPMDKVAQRLLSPTLFNRNIDFQQYERGSDGSGFFIVNEYKPENLASATSRVFLGVKLECAQCHKHPFAKWTRDQFWEFAAFYSGLPNNRRIDVDGLVVPAQGKQKFVPGREILIPESNKLVKAKFLTGQDPDWSMASNGSQVLAEWVASPKNPYFARAMVDHVWSYVFGTSLHDPIVEPVDDGQITHEGLLDDLAREFVAHKFDLKFLIRALVHTQAYQRTSGGNRPAEADDYHLYLRMPIRSLTPDQLFDNLVEATDFRRDTATIAPNNPFAMQINTPRGEFLAKFSIQDRKYDPQTTILQALFMMNGKFISERSKVSENDSLKTLALQKTDVRVKVNTLYMWVLSRRPRAEEMQRSLQYLESGGPTQNRERAFEDFYWALLNSPEFLLNH